MSRLTASSMIAAVDGPKATRSARRKNASNCSVKSKPSVGCTRWLISRTANSPAAMPTVSST